MSLKISLIAAVSKNQVIGKNGGLPWCLPEDLKYFKKKTLGHPVIMGRKTFDEIKKPLPGRDNFVITRQKDLVIPGVKVFFHLSAVLGFLEKQFKNEEKEIFIVGGEQIYRAALEQKCVNRIYLTDIDENFEGDAYFPEFYRGVFREVSRESHAENRPFFSFVIYEKEI